MKKGLYLMLALFAVFTVIMASCGGDDATDKITIVFDTDSGSEVKSIDIDKDSALPADYFGTGDKVPTKQNYKFNGWKDGETEVTNEYKFSKGTTLKAQWTLQQVTVSFSMGDGVTGTTPPSFPSYTIDVGTTLGNRFPTQTPTRNDGWEFTGWFNGGTRYYNNTPINSVTPTFILTAQWEEEEEYQVEYAQNPAIHPGNGFNEIVPDQVKDDPDLTGGVIKVQAGVSFSANGLFSNIEKDAGVLSSKWYCTTVEGGQGVEIAWSQTASPSSPNELSLPFTWTESVPGTYWYWVAVTNYNENATVQKYSTATPPDRLKVIVQ